MKRSIPLIIVAAMMVSAVPAFAQTVDTAKAAHSQDVQTKMRKVDLLLQIMPLVLRKDQFPAILAELERIRAKQAEVLSREDDEIIKLEAKLDEALKKANDDGIYPSRDLQLECFKLTRALGTVRNMARTDFASQLYKVVDTVFDKGQKAIAAKSLDWKLFDPSLKLDEKPQEDQIKFYLKLVLLDPLAYDVLVDLSKKAK
jgi:hypothetical protein